MKGLTLEVPIGQLASLLGSVVLNIIGNDQNYSFVIAYAS